MRGVGFYPTWELQVQLPLCSGTPGQWQRMLDAVTIAAAAVGAVCWCLLSLSPGSWPVMGTSSRRGCCEGEHGAWGRIILQEVEACSVQGETSRHISRWLAGNSTLGRASRASFWCSQQEWGPHPRRVPCPQACNPDSAVVPACPCALVPLPVWLCAALSAFPQIGQPPNSFFFFFFKLCWLSLQFALLGIFTAYSFISLRLFLKY